MFYILRTTSCSLLGYFTLKSHLGDLQGTDNTVFHVALEVKETVFPFVLRLRSCALKEKNRSEKDECSLKTLREPCISFYGWAVECCCLCRLLIIWFPEPL